jgi:DNA-binding NarL/FixJ family response regulator
MSGTDPMPAVVRVMLVEEHALVREGVRKILEGEPGFEVVGEANRGDDALKLLDGLRPDVVLMEARLPGMSGIETTRRIRGASPEVRVLILSAQADFVLEAMRAGASGYVLKTGTSRSLVAALRSVFLGLTVLQGELTAGLGIWGPSARSQQTDVLSRREAQILRLIARGLTNRAIAREVSIAPRTADQHVHNILIKVGARSRAEAVRYAVEHELASAKEVSALWPHDRDGLVVAAVRRTDG